jgi:hypothetical protein
MTACQLDLAGKARVAGDDASGASGSIDPDDSSPDAIGFVPTSDPNSAQDAGVPGLVGRSPADAADEATAAMGIDSSQDAGGLDSSAASVGADAGTPCARLLECCPRLLAPPLALACIAGAMQDGGDRACETTLSSLVDAGVCP